VSTGSPGVFARDENQKIIIPLLYIFEINREFR
jgi:hypothetical protein